MTNKSYYLNSCLTDRSETDLELLHVPTNKRRDIALTFKAKH